MIDVARVLKRIYYKVGYEVRTEMWRYSPGKNLKIRYAYNPSGVPIGRPKVAHKLFVKRGIRFVEPHLLTSNICSIGFNPTEQKWYGWSHRAFVGFKIGDRIFDSEYGHDKTPFIHHGRKKIRTLADAKLAASNFAEYVS